jgi:hypothetical protein
MSQPVKLSDELVMDARRAGEVLERSIAGQIEFWARLGQGIEPLIKGDTAMAIRRSGMAKPLSECFREVETEEGHKRLKAYLESRPFPHFEGVPGNPHLLVRIEANGTRTIGKFVKGQFKQVDLPKHKTPSSK